MKQSGKKAPFIVFEGVDGSGKSTQVRWLRNRFREEGIPHYITQEPTDSPVGGVIRQIMTGRVKADNRAIALLFAADRVDHLQNDVNGILAMVEGGTAVISDRYYLSSLAYHAVDMPMDWVLEINRVSRDLLRPDVHFFIDTKIESVMERIRRRGASVELYEKEARLKLVRENYLQAISRLEGEEKIVVLDGNEKPERIASQVWETVRGLF